ncbi:MAG: type secretion outer rane, TolC family protein [Gammaproteobacteria bacterium]|jgi:adhesin transport system outer membrane protein|nr:type secretion outer rane, TolC family protein [Gammaproteobacteria bacterium]
MNSNGMHPVLHFAHQVLAFIGAVMILSLLGIILVSYAKENNQQEDVAVFVRKGHTFDVNNKQSAKTPKKNPGLSVNKNKGRMSDWTNNRSNLQKVLQFALANHPKTLSAQSEIRAAEETLLSTHGELLPNVTASAAYGPERTNNVTTRAEGNNHVDLIRQEKVLEIRQLIYDGGKVLNRVSRDEAELAATKQTAIGIRESVSLHIINAYLNILRYRERLDISQKDVKSHLKNRVKIKKRFQGGASRRSELQLSDTRVTQAQARYETELSTMEQANHVFMQEVGKAPAPILEKTALNASQLPQELDIARTIALKNNPLIAAAQANVDSAGQNIAALRANYLPTISLDLQAQYDNELDGVIGQNNQNMALIRADYNLYNGGSDRAEIKKAIEQRDKALQELALTRRDIDERVSTAWTDMKVYEDRLKILKRNVASTAAVVKSYRLEFDIGQRSLLDVLDAENEYFSARTGLADGQYDYLLSQYRLLEAMGMLVPTILAG